MTLKESAIVIFIFLISAILIGVSLNYQSTPIYVDNITITIVEKYPVHSYEEQCGKTRCTFTDPPKVVDENGTLYIVDGENLWAKMFLNHKYNVQFAKYPNNVGNKIIGVNKEV